MRLSSKEHCEPFHTPSRCKGSKVCVSFAHCCCGVWLSPGNPVFSTIWIGRAWTPTDYAGALWRPAGTHVVSGHS